jgi:hypothetical protein
LEVNRKQFFVAFFLVFLFFQATAQEENDWVFKTYEYANREPEMDLSLEFDDSVVARIDSNDQSCGVWKLYKIIEHPQSDAFEITLKTKVIAPETDFDFSRSFSSGEGEDNDGPNFFGFVYCHENATHEDPGFMDSYNFLEPYGSESELCHVHFECNWVGDIEQYYGLYCPWDPQNPAKPGWVADGEGSLPAQLYESSYSAEAFGDDWKNIILDIKADDCLCDKLTIVFTGMDPTQTHEYTWLLKDVQLEYTDDGSVEEELSLEEIYDVAAEDYVDPPPYCGNKQKDPGEECDGDAPEGYYCTPDCTLTTECGDNLIAGDEVCDGTKVTEGFECKDCEEEVPICGDGIKVEGELCDWGMTGTEPDYHVGFNCSQDCKTMTAICGDGLVVGNETCDQTNGTDAFHGCTSDCNLYRILSSQENNTVSLLFSLASISTIGKPKESFYTITDPGFLELQDFKDQVKLNPGDLPPQSEFQFCREGIPECEEGFMLDSGKVFASNQTMQFNPTSGTFKVYRTEKLNKTVFYIGFAAERELSPLLGEYGAIIVLVGAFVTIGLLLLIIGVIVFFYLKRKKKRKK